MEDAGKGSITNSHAPQGVFGRAQLIDQDGLCIDTGDGVQGVVDHAKVRARDKAAKEVKVKHVLELGKVVGHGVDDFHLKIAKRGHTDLQGFGWFDGIVDITIINQYCCEHVVEHAASWCSGSSSNMKKDTENPKSRPW